MESIYQPLQLIENIDIINNFKFLWISTFVNMNLTLYHNKTKHNVIDTDL